MFKRKRKINNITELNKILTKHTIGRLKIFITQNKKKNKKRLSTNLNQAEKKI